MNMHPSIMFLILLLGIAHVSVDELGTLTLRYRSVMHWQVLGYTGAYSPCFAALIRTKRFVLSRMAWRMAWHMVTNHLNSGDYCITLRLTQNSREKNTPLHDRYPQRSYILPLPHIGPFDRVPLPLRAEQDIAVTGATGRVAITLCSATRHVEVAQPPASPSR
jgi:hypothetical protein